MEEHKITLADARAATPIPTLEGPVYLGSWAWLGTDRMAWTAAYQRAGKFKCSCFVHDLDSGAVKTLAIPGGQRGPVVTASHLTAGGGANGATPAVFDRDTLKKVAGLKGHKSQLNGLAALGPNTALTIGGRNARPFDNTLRLWDLTSQRLVCKVKLPKLPQNIAAGGDRIYVRTWQYKEETELHAFDATGAELWSRPDGDKMSSPLCVSHDGQTLAQVLGLEVRLLDRDGGVLHSVKPGLGARCQLAFSADDRWLFVSFDGASTRGGTTVFDVASGQPVMRIAQVIGLRPGEGGELGGFFGEESAITHFVAFAGAPILG